MDNKKESKFKINTISLLGSFCYNFPKNSNTDCSICRNNLNFKSPTTEEKCIECHVVIGECGHLFHQDCITSFLKFNQYCPICSTLWKQNKNNPNLS
jgi:hypothetical protein